MLLAVQKMLCGALDNWMHDLYRFGLRVASICMRGQLQALHDYYIRPCHLPSS
jgi:hypothetical protein